MTSPQWYQQANLPSTCQRSTPLLPTPGNYSSYSLLPSPLILTSGIIRAPFKTATVKPLLKKPTLDSVDIQNYRHLSLLSFLSRTLELAAYNQPYSYISENDFLDPNQSGFRTGHSTEMALLTMTELLGAARATSNSSVLILLGLSSAFDTVNNQILLSTLAELGIADCALTWFTSYLTNCTFQVTWNGALSKPCFLKTGVPQGSVLGPLLFSLYTRTLASNHIAWILLPLLCWQHSTVPLLSLILLQHPRCTGISECLADIFACTAAHHLKLNLSKSELLFTLGTALTLTCQSLSRMSRYCLRWWLGTRVYSSMMDCPAPPTSLLWPGSADLPSTTQAGTGFSSQKMQRNSWSTLLAGLCD